MSRATGIAITVVVAILIGWAAWFVVSDDVPDPLPVGDRVEQAVEALRESNVYVAPDSADLLSGADLARIEAAASASQPETFVVVWEVTTESGFYLPVEGLRQIGAELDRPGYYVSVGRGGVSSDDVGIKGDYAHADAFAEGEVIDQRSVAAKIDQIIAESDGREFSEASTTASAYWGGTSGTIAAGLLFGALAGAVLAGVLTAVWFIIRNRRRSQP